MPDLLKKQVTIIYNKYTISRVKWKNPGIFILWV